MGTLIKRLLCNRLGLKPADVYHAAIMPCYDKKLEASRAEFNVPGSHTCTRGVTLLASQLYEALYCFSGMITFRHTHADRTCRMTMT